MDEGNDILDEKAIRKRISILVGEVHSADVERRRAAAQEIYEIAYKTPELAKSAVPALVHSLCDPDEKIGESALWGLKYCAPESIDPLIECLAHTDAKVRERASHSLGNIGDEAIVACHRLRTLLDDPVQEVRTRAMWALGLIHDTSDRTISRLFEMASSPNPRERSSAFHALGNIGQALVDPQPLRSKQQEILEALQDEDESVRRWAGYVVESLGLDPAEHAALIVRRLRSEQSSEIRESLVRSLKKLVSETDLADYLPSLCDVISKGGNEAREMCEVLAAMGHRARAAVPCLLDAVRGNELLVIEGAKALWKIDGRINESLPALERVFDDNPQAVCDAICEIGPAATPLLPKIVQALKSEDDWDVEWAAADALGHIASADPAVLSVLASALGHPSPIVRSAAGRALARTGSAALPVLQKILSDPLDERAEWAADAVGQMGHIGAPAAETLRRHLRSEKFSRTTWSAIALAKVAGDPAVIPILGELLRNDRSDLRKEAALALKAIGPAAKSALPALRSALEDEDDEVRASVQDALDAISSQKH